MSLTTHLTMIQDKHGKLEGMISEESHRPMPDFGLIQTLKKQKLLLKEELERLRLLSQERVRRCMTASGATPAAHRVAQP